ncbi:hypothetical protein [Phenylobacterium sp.]|uniref:hypothetical protein n=1 Tax=Phenylobacterium sp. TaxID=1871053 RepID=UPI00199AF65B|nr:hypothetical protein [Phenylobacterium sp.]MBC7169023.1 hypothetical protein [Phenylobacterium sp.]
MNALVPVASQTSNVEAYRASTDAANLCKEIVVASALEIQDRKYVRVEGWQAIAIAHGCTASARDVERVEGGVRAIGEVRRMSDGAVIAEAEGFVGEDEPTWYGGTVRAWKWGERRGEKVWYDKELPKRADYAIRAMAQTRAISRACRSAFAHVVVMMNAGLSTTPAEEVPPEGFEDREPARREEPRRAEPRQQAARRDEDIRDADVEDGPPPTERGIYIACKAAIDLCETKQALTTWAKENEPSLARIKAEDVEVYDAVLAHWRAQLKALPNEQTPPPPQADDEFGLAGDDIPEFA